MLRKLIATLTVASVASVAWSQDLAQPDMAQYEVTIINITRGQTFTPQLAITHAPQFQVFVYGQPASPGLEILAESGDPVPIWEEAKPNAYAFGVNRAMLGPGESVTIPVEGVPEGFISIMAMMLPTNDTFVALSRARLPRVAFSRLLRAYDAGTEANDQSCDSIPGPMCGGEGLSEGVGADDEGYVYISNGIHDLGTEIGPAEYDWRDAVARVIVRRVDN